MLCSGFYSLSILYTVMCICQGFPGGSDGKKSACNARDLGLILGLGRSLGEGSGRQLQFLAWRMLWTGEPVRLYTVHEVTKSWTRLSD